MYASNEDEEWIYLQPTSASNHVVPNEVTDDFVLNSSSSSSSSSRSERTTSSSVSSIEDEPETVQPPILIEPALLTEDDETTCATMRDTDRPISSASTSTKSILLSRRFCSNRPTSASRRFRRRTTSNGQQTDLDPSPVTRSTSIFSCINPIKRDRQNRNKDDAFIAYVFLVLLFVLPLFLGYCVSRWNQPAMEKIVIELDRVNQRLNGLSATSAQLMEKELTAQVNTLTLQIQQLREDLQRTEQTLALRIHQLTLENHRLREEFKAQSNDAKIDDETVEIPSKDIPKADSAKSFTEKIFLAFMHNTMSMAGETSAHLGGLFHLLSESVVNVLDHTQEYLEKKQQKWADLSNASTTERIQREVRQHLHQISSSLHRVTLHCLNWFKSSEQKRNTNSGRRPSWRWNVRSDKEPQRTYQHGCHDGRFPTKQIRSIKAWIAKIIRR